MLEAAALREGVLIPPDPSPSASAGGFTGTVTANNTLGEIDASPGGVIVPPSGAAGEHEDEEDENHPTKIQLPSGNWIPYDVMIGVSIGDGSVNPRGRHRWWGLRGAKNDGKRVDKGDGSGGRRKTAEDGEGVGGAEGGVRGVAAGEAAEESESGEESESEGSSAGAATETEGNSSAAGAVNGTE